VLDIENLAVEYRQRSGVVTAVRDVNLTLGTGEAVGLVGESGCGKSTLALALLRHNGPGGAISAGRIRYRGEDIAGFGSERLRRLRGGKIAMVYQEPTAALNPSLRLAAQLAEVVAAHEDVSQAAVRERVLTALGEVHLPDSSRILRSYPHQLSGGEQQRAVIAMALLGRPELLVLDEPTTALDATVEAAIVGLLGELRRRYRMAMLFISHNLGLVREVCDRVLIMYAGGIVEAGTTTGVLTAPQHPYTRGLLACVPAPGARRSERPLMAIRGQPPTPGAMPPGCAFAARCDHALIGLCDRREPALTPLPDRPEHAVRCLRLAEIGSGPASPPAAHPSPAPPGEEFLRLTDVRKHYRAATALGGWRRERGARPLQAVDGVSFVVRRGETVALVGESGSGKSTLARVILGIETASAGEVHFRGEAVGTMPVGRRRPEQRGALQIVFQNPDQTLNPSLTVGHQIARAVRKLSTVRGAAEVARRVAALLAMVRLPPDLADRLPAQLSGGQRQRVSIARALAGDPALVVADEPVSALDVSVQAAIVALLDDIQRRHATGLVFISHDLALVRYLADHVVVMYGGRVMEQGPSEQVFTPPHHPYTEALLAALPLADPAWRERRAALHDDAHRRDGGCPFAARCRRQIGEKCRTERPPVQRAGAHRIACHIPLAELRLHAPALDRGPG